MNPCYWEEIHGFVTPGEYRRFCTWLADQVDEGVIEELPVTEPSKDIAFGLVERHFRCKASGEIWRLVAPDTPFLGYWGP